MFTKFLLSTNLLSVLDTLIKLFFPNGDAAIGKSIPKNKTRKSVTWKEIFKKDSFQLSDRGYWPYSYKIYWKDRDGNERVTKSEGEIRLRVVSSKYVPLHESPENENFTWLHTTRNGEVVRMTTGGRTFVSKRVKDKTFVPRGDK